MQTKSFEEKIEDIVKKKIDDLGIKRYTKTEPTGNSMVDNALKNGESKKGNNGGNYPDIKLVLVKNGRCIPVMIEIKGTKGKLKKTDKTGGISKDIDSVVNYAVNGAAHYGEIILKNSGLQEIIIVGINGIEENGIIKGECEGYYLSRHNYMEPKIIDKITFDDFSLFKDENLDKLFDICKKCNMTEDAIEFLIKEKERYLEEHIKKIHQDLYDNVQLQTALTTNSKLYLFCGLIMAGLSIKGSSDLEPDDLKSFDNETLSDGAILLNRIKAFVKNKGNYYNKADRIVNLLTNVFEKDILWKPKNGESILKQLYTEVKEDIIPILNSELHLDFTGRILNSINDWVHIENDRKNDVVLTPRYITQLMAKLARTNMDSYVWDSAMGSAGFLVSAMDIMIRDAQNKIVDITTLNEKIRHIKEQQIFGIEILDNIYMLAVLNMILMGDGSSNIQNSDSHNFKLSDLTDFKANVFLLNPPYSAKGNGFIFVEEALQQMQNGYACIIIQDSAGNGQGLPYTKSILNHNTLEASIKMPSKLLKASVSVYIFVIKIGRPHELDDLVTFIDFSEDGYSRLNRKKSTQEVNLRDTDHAKDRYAEIEAIVLGKKPKTNYYTEQNGKVIKDTITLNGNDWLFTQHQKIETMPTEDDFKKVVTDYLSWKVSTLMRGED